MTGRDIAQDAKDSALNTLQDLLDDIDGTEKRLLEELETTSAAQLNDTRVSFCTESSRLQRSLDEWMAGNKAEIPADFAAPCPLPDYAKQQGGALCIPGGSILIRPDEPGSVIAYTLS
jgi:1-phosphatidylinositol-3-phosphate 5-kinase